MGMDTKQGMHAVLFGFAAAAVGLIGAYALNRAGLKTKWSIAGANIAAAALGGGVVGAFDRTAGTIIAHNYGVTALQFLAAGGSSGGQVATRPLKGLEDQAMGEYQALEGVVADDLGDPMEGYEALEGVVADDLGTMEEEEEMVYGG